MGEFKPTNRYLNIRNGEWVPVQEVPYGERGEVWRGRYVSPCDTVVRTKDGSEHLVGRTFLETIREG